MYVFLTPQEDVEAAWTLQPSRRPLSRRLAAGNRATFPACRPPAEAPRRPADLLDPMMWQGCFFCSVGPVLGGVVTYFG